MTLDIDGEDGNDFSPTNKVSFCKDVDKNKTVIRVGKYDYHVPKFIYGQTPSNQSLQISRESSTQALVIANIAGGMKLPTIS